jgi:Mn-dependent DtxR family transcriptional regulator
MRGGKLEMKSNESSEDYLETILVLGKDRPVVRAVDIANELGYKKSSVSVAMRNLFDRGHISISNEGYIGLTESGRKIAERVYERHVLISDWLKRIGVSEKTALEDACRVEHYLSDESFNAIKKYVFPLLQNN